MVFKVGEAPPHIRIEMYVLEYELFTTTRVRYSKAGGSSALILNDENGMFAKRISGSDCDITIRQKRA